MGVRDDGSSPVKKVLQMSDNQPRAYTAEEMRDTFMSHVAQMAHYWGTLKDTDGTIMTPLDRCNGLAFSLLAALVEIDKSEQHGVIWTACIKAENLIYKELIALYDRS